MLRKIKKPVRKTQKPDRKIKITLRKIEKPVRKFKFPNRFLRKTNSFFDFLSFSFNELLPTRLRLAVHQPRRSEYMTRPDKFGNNSSSPIRMR